MNLDMLLKAYVNDPRCFKIVDRITASQPQQIQLFGFYGSEFSFVVSAVFNHMSATNLNILIIFLDVEEVAFYDNTLVIIKIEL